MDNIVPGQQLGPYRIVNQIGQGGMATVYKAYHAAMDRYVALKVLPSQLAQNQEFVQRFEQEARTIAKLEHAHILPVYDYGEQGNITYLVMRYLDAGTLKERIQGQQLALAEVDKYFSQLAGALAYAHEMGVIHRDIKPSNVMVNSRGELFLTDFGIAKLLESTAQFTATGSITGTPAYMSPEQAQGEKLDLRSDIYSLGIVLYEMITGKVPFEAETPLAVILKQITAQLPPPTSLNPDLSPEIERVILKALAKNRDDRFATCDDFLNAWKQAITHSNTVNYGATASPPVVVSATSTTTPSTAPKPVTTSTVKTDSIRAEAGRVEKKGNILITSLKWFAVAVGFFSFLCIAAVGAMFILSICPPQGPWIMPPWCETKVTPAASAPVASPLTVSTKLPSVSGGGEWKSWSALNYVTTLEVQKGRVVAGGLNGLSFWNFDGKVNDRFNMTDGLPHSSVSALFTDQDDSLWVGTEHGLLHIEGKKLTPYLEEQGLDTAYISTIERVGKRLLVGTMYSHEGGGLNEFDPQTNRFKPITFPSVHEDQKTQLSYNVTSIATDKSGALWVATTNGVGRFDGNTWTRFGTENGLGSNRVNRVYTDSLNRLWVGTEQGAALWDGGTRFTSVGDRDARISDIAIDGKGMLWFTYSNGIARFNPSDKQWTRFAAGQNTLPDTNYSSVKVVDKDIYFGTSAGIVQYSSEGKFNLWSAPNSLAFPLHSRILATADGALWFIERYGIGVEQVDISTQQWSRVKSLQCDCEPLLIVPDSVIIAREYGNGLWIVMPNRRVNLTTKNGLPSDRVTTAVWVKGTKTIWVGTEDGAALIEYETQTVKQVYDRSRAGFAANEVRAIFYSTEKSLWVGTDNGLSVLRNNRWEHFTVNQPFGRDMVSIPVIVQAPDSSVWVGTIGDGLYRWKDGKWDRFSARDPGVGLPTNDVHSMTVAPDGSVWIGTEGGAARLDGKQWQTFRMEPNKLIAPSVDDLWVLPSGEVWFTTTGGVSVYKP